MWKHNPNGACGDRRQKQEDRLAICFFVSALFKSEKESLDTSKNSEANPVKSVLLSPALRVGQDENILIYYAAD